MKKKMIIFVASFALVVGTSVAIFGHSNPTSTAPADTVKVKTSKHTMASDTTKSAAKSKSSMPSDTTSKK